MDVRRYIREVARPMSSEPTGVVPKLNRLEGIRAVAFDIYGTLLISEAGDVNSNCSERRLKAMEFVSEHLGGNLEAPSLLRDYKDGISRRLSKARKNGVNFPEVEIRDIWRDILVSRLPEAPDADLIEEVAIIYECASNPAWIMPGARELLQVLIGFGLKLGIISNAQFYTPLVLEELFESSLSDLGFSEGWVTLSYKLREGKPSPTVYRESSDCARDLCLSPDEVLYVGNDMKKDIEPAAAIGFRTCLFAGDARSFRLGERTLDEARRIADVVVTELVQIVDVLDVRR